MADEGGASSSNSFDETTEKKSRSASFTSGMISASRLSSNPFAIKTSTPTRSVADSTENKESRPLVAPPTLILDGPSTVSSSSMPKIVLRPSALAAQAEKLKLVNMKSGSKYDDAEEENDDDGIGSKEVNSTFCESNGKIAKGELSMCADSPSKMLPSRSSDNFSFAPTKSDEVSGDSSASFVFGQNLHERVLNYDDASSHSSPTTSSLNLTFEEAASQESEKEHTEEEAKSSKSLKESAQEYQSRQIKRKFDEVAVITGEEEESNVLQINCKLFAFNKISSFWQERGRGILRLNDREVNGILHSRVVMRTQGSLRVVLNSKVWSGMSVEHPTTKTIRISAIDTDGIKVFLIMAHPKDAEQLFSALDWRVTTLKSREETNHRRGNSEPTVEEATSSTGLPDSSSNDGFESELSKRPRISSSEEMGADSSSEVNFVQETNFSSENLVDSTDSRGTVCFTSIESDDGDNQNSN